MGERRLDQDQEEAAERFQWCDFLADRSAGTRWEVGLFREGTEDILASDTMLICTFKSTETFGYDVDDFMGCFCYASNISHARTA